MEILWRLVLQESENYQNLLHKMLLNLGEFTKNFYETSSTEERQNVQNMHVCMSLHRASETETFLKFGRRPRDLTGQGKTNLECKRACLLPSVWSKLFFFKSPPFLHLYSLNPILCFTSSFPIVQITC